MKIILVRYGELTLKGKNRSEFERALYNNIKKQLLDFEINFYKDAIGMLFNFIGNSTHISHATYEFVIVLE